MKTELRAIADGDLAIFFEQQLQAEANRMSASTPRDRAAFMTHWAKAAADPKVLRKTILSGGHVVGYVASFERLEKREVCYWLGKEYWGRGIASKALAEFLAEENQRPLWARVAKRNAASIRVLEKCGFAKVGDDKYSNSAGEEVEEFVFKLIDQDRMQFMHFTKVE
jgi:RimJ/RimL family protein N-acetyltransferase